MRSGDADLHKYRCFMTYSEFCLHCLHHVDSIGLRHELSLIMDDGKAMIGTRGYIDNRHAGMITHHILAYDTGLQSSSTTAHLDIGVTQYEEAVPA